MCALVRCTVSRAAPFSRMRMRVWRARRNLESFLSLIACPLLLLRLFQDDHFVRVAYALALVRLGGPVRAHLRRHLSDELLVDAGKHDLGLAWGGHLDAL